MAITMLAAVDFTKVPALQFVVPVVSADPTGYEAGLIYNSTTKELKYHNGTKWVPLTEGTGGAAGGDLTGTYPNPQIATGVIVDADVAAANKDGAAATPSMRTLGTGANQAAPGNDTRFTDARPPTGAASGDLSGTYPAPQIAAGVIVDADVAAANKDGGAAVPSMRTLGTGANQAAPGNDPRFTDSRPPSGTAGGDLSGTYPNPQIAAGVIVDADVATANKDGVAATPSMRTLGMGAQQALAGNTPLNSITQPTSFVSLNSQRIVNLADPTTGTDGANKNYVDLAMQGLTFKNAVRVVSTVNQAAISGLLTIDGVTLVSGDRVLLAAQTTQAQNGIFTAAPGAWTRAQDADANNEIKDGTVVPVAEGTANADTLYICTGVGTPPWVPGTNISTWTKFLSLADLVAGAGLTKTGTTIDFVAGNSTLTVAADSVVVASAPKWTTPVSFTLTGDVTGTAASVDGSAAVSIATTLAAGAKSWAGDIPAGTSCIVTHNLNTRDVSVTVYRNSTPWDTVLCDVERTTTTSVTIKFASAVTAGQFRAVVAGR